MDPKIILNDEQQHAVTCPSDTPLLILAGAGSGKTQVTVSRILWFIHKCNIHPSKIVAVTFSKNAATEMQARLDKLQNKKATHDVKNKNDDPFIGTIHSFCCLILRQYGDRIGFESDFEIIDEKETLRIMRDIYKEILIDEIIHENHDDKEKKKHNKKPIKTKTICNRINMWRIEGKEPWHIESAHGDIFHDIYIQYREHCRHTNKIDFIDLLLHTKRLCSHYADVLSQCKERWTHVLVDEFQDTDPLQYKVIQLLFDQYITAVGDDYQTIHGWRGACIDNILSFEKKYPNASVATLCNNYRSQEMIVKAAQALILNNQYQLHKDMKHIRPAEDRVQVIKTNDWNKECMWVIRKIKNIVDQDACILGRKNADLELFEPLLIQYNIPYRFVSKSCVRFLDRKLVKTMVAYLAFVYGVCSDEQFKLVATMKSRGIGPSTFVLLEEYAIKHGMPVAVAGREILTQMSQSNPLNLDTHNDIRLKTKARAGLTSMYEFADSLLENNKSLISNYNACLLDITVTKEGKDHKDHKDASKQKNGSPINDIKDLFIDDDMDEEEDTTERQAIIKTFLRSFVEYNSKTLKDVDAIRAWLLQLYHFDAQQSMEQDSCKVSLLTIHSSKGLQFDNVYIINVEQDEMPNSAFGITEHRVYEERRLFYVGITRAVHNVYITYRNSPSMFIKELPEEYVTTTIMPCKKESTRRS